MLADLWACSMPTCDLDYRTSDVIPRGCCVPARKLRESDTLLLSAVMGHDMQTWGGGRAKSMQPQREYWPGTLALFGDRQKTS